MQRKTQMGHGGYNTVGQTGQVQKENHKEEDLRLRKRQKNGMHVFCCNNHLTHL